MKLFDYDDETGYTTGPEDYGYIHEDDVPDLDHCREMLEGILESIYKTGDIDKLEDCLDELCGAFDIQMIASHPVLTKRDGSLNAEKDNIVKETFDLGIALARAQGDQLHVRS